MKNLVIIGLVIPEPKSTAAGSRMLQLINIFRQAGFNITFLTSATNTTFSEAIEVRNINLNNDDFDVLISELEPDIVLFDRFITEEQFGWRVTEHCPNALRILDTEDLHFLREARKTAWKQNKIPDDSDFINGTFKREIASILRCDLTLLISDFEFQLLVSTYRISPEIVFYIPFLFDGSASKGKDFSDRKNFMSIGNFLHEPNWQTVLQLKKLWPKIKQHQPNSEMHIYGAYASDKVFQLENKKEGFIIKGRAESAKEIFENYRVLLAPIPFGAGLKGKLFESMKFGIPSITSDIGAEGMHDGNVWNGYIENNPQTFCEKASQLYEDEKLWKAAQQNGFEILRNRFDQAKFSSNIIKRIFEIKENLNEHRNRNFLGQILQHHTLQSTKFMSKWIEEKNKHQERNNS